MTLLERIADHDAAEALAGVIVDTRRGARLAVEHGVTAEAFVSPPLRRVFEAAVRCDATQLDRRLVVVACEAEVDVSWLADLLERRPVMFDDSGVLARRVIAAGERWRRVVDLVVELEELTGGAVLAHLTSGARLLEIAA